MVTSLPVIAMSLTCENMSIKKSSLASWSAKIAVDWNLGGNGTSPSLNRSWTTSRTRRWKGSFRIKSSVDFWYLFICLRATVPGRNRRFFLTRPVGGLRGFFTGPVFTLLLVLVIVVILKNLNCDRVGLKHVYFHDFLVSWFHDFMISWFHDFMITWFHDFSLHHTHTHSLSSFFNHEPWSRSRVHIQNHFNKSVSNHPWASPT